MNGSLVRIHRQTEKIIDSNSVLVSSSFRLSVIWLVGFGCFRPEITAYCYHTSCWCRVHIRFQVHMSTWNIFCHLFIFRKNKTTNGKCILYKKWTPKSKATKMTTIELRNWLPATMYECSCIVQHCYSRNAEQPIATAQHCAWEWEAEADTKTSKIANK